MRPIRPLHRFFACSLAVAVALTALGAEQPAQARGKRATSSKARKAPARRAARGGRIVARLESGGRTRPGSSGGLTEPAKPQGGTKGHAGGGTTTSGGGTTTSGGGTTTGGTTTSGSGTPSAGLYVDGQSLGGACDDSRTPSQVSFQTPWCTLAAAANKAVSGSTVYVRTGSYTQLAAPQLGAIDFRAYGSEQPVIAGLQVGGAGFAFRGFKFTNTLAITNFNGVTIAGNEIALTPNGLSTPNGVSLTPPGSNFTFTGNYVHDGQLAILTRQPGSVSPFTNFTIAGNRFVRNGGVVMHINYGNHWVVSGNEFADNGRFANIDPNVHPDAVHIVGADDDLLFDSNYVHSTTGGRGFLFEPTGNTQSRVVVQNNVIVGTTNDFALRVTSGTPGMVIVNNTFWLGQPTQGDGLHLGSIQEVPTPNLVVENNIVNHFEVDSGPYPVTFAKADYNMVGVREPNTPTPVGPHDVAGPPSFVALSAPTWNARLASGSPGIDAGDPTVAPLLDADGHARGGAVDLGAYEYGT